MDNNIPLWRVVVLNTYDIIMKPESVLTDNKLVEISKREKKAIKSLVYGNQECSFDGRSSLWMDEQANEESCVLKQYESYTELARVIPFSAHVALYGNGQMIMDKN